MTIRTYQAGDELAQVSIYNEAASGLAKFKPATLDEVRRRIVAADFDPASRFYAVEKGLVVGYCNFQPNGRVSLPWCRKGQEKWAEPLFERVLEVMRQRGLKRAFAAYRADWDVARDFLVAHGFTLAREMLNWCLDLVEMPTPSARPTSSVGTLSRADLPAIHAMGAGVFRVSLAELEKALFENPWFGPDSLFTLRGRTDGALSAVGILVQNPAYADVKAIDAAMPCFRLGAFGTEGLTTKRVNGLFSFLVANPQDVSRLGIDLLGHAVRLLQETQLETLAAQVASDVPHLVRFYKQYFHQQGRFPIYERSL